MLEWFADSTFSPLNAGGPLIDGNGELVGIVSWGVGWYVRERVVCHH